MIIKLFPLLSIAIFSWSCKKDNDTSDSSAKTGGTSRGGVINATPFAKCNNVRAETGELIDPYEEKSTPQFVEFKPKVLCYSVSDPSNRKFFLSSSDGCSLKVFEYNYDQATIVDPIV